MEINIIELFTKGALLECPDKVGFSEEGRAYTFREIDNIARSLATELIRRDIRKGECVAVFMPKCAATLIADLGIIYAGLVYMNMDTEAPRERVAHILNTVRPALCVTDIVSIVTQRNIAPNIPSIVWEYDELRDIVPNDSAIAQRVSSIIDTDSLCIISTSGSTGVPKSAALSHRGIIDFVSWWRRTLPFRNDEVVGSLSPFFFDGYIVGFWMTLLTGARLEIIPSRLASFPVRLAEFMRDRGVTFIFWVPSIMVTLANFGIFDTVKIPTLRTICFAGEVFPAKHFNYWKANFPTAMFINLYGPIEISVICTYFVVDREISDDDAIPIGSACSNAEIIIINQEGAAAKSGEIGELYVRGSCLAHGYWNSPENTARAFVQNPLHCRYPEIVYKTGDLGYFNDRQEIVFVGRNDFQVKHLGFRFDLGEIEHFALLAPQVKYACVCYARAEKRIHLFLEAERSYTIAEIRAFLASRMSKHMLPHQLHQLPELPKNANGKIDRTALAAKIESRV